MVARRILLLSKYSRKGASSRLRSIQYIPLLKIYNIEVTQESLFSDDYLNTLYTKQRRSKLYIIQAYLHRIFTLCKAGQYDLIWIEKELLPYCPAIFERILRLFNIPYIVDYDDAIFHNYDSSNSFILSNVLKKKITIVMKHAAHVIVGNKYLEDYAINAGAKQITCIPTVVDPSRYIPKKYEGTSRGKQKTIGWIGSPSTQDYMLRLKPCLIATYKKYKTKLLLVGANDIIGSELSDIDVEIVPWQEEKEAYLISRMDIGLMPLDDGKWEKGKCGYKLIQYMASGIPVIASPIEVNVDIVTHSNSGLLAVTIEEWETCCFELLESEEARQGMGQAGRKAVENIYSTTVQVEKLARILTQYTN